MSKNLPQKLSEKQELLRQQTINRVIRAISEVQADGRKVTIANLVEFTELSRSVFAKPHIRELLTEYGYENSKTAPCERQRRTKKQTNAMAEKNNRIEQLQIENAALTRECELLRGRLFWLMQR